MARPLKYDKEFLLKFSSLQLEFLKVKAKTQGTTVSELIREQLGFEGPNVSDEDFRKQQENYHTQIEKWHRHQEERIAKMEASLKEQREKDQREYFRSLGQR